jgi:hypothetical protein
MGDTAVWMIAVMVIAGAVLKPGIGSSAWLGARRDKAKIKLVQRININATNIVNLIKEYLRIGRTGAA